MRNKLRELVLVKVIGWIEAIEPALATLASHNIWTAHKDDRNELEWGAQSVDLVVRNLVFELGETSVIAE